MTREAIANYLAITYDINQSVAGQIVDALAELGVLRVRPASPVASSLNMVPVWSESWRSVDGAGSGPSVLPAMCPPSVAPLSSARGVVPTATLMSTEPAYVGVVSQPSPSPAALNMVPLAGESGWPGEGGKARDLSTLFQLHQMS